MAAHRPVARENALVSFPREDGSRVPYKVFSSQEIYDLEQERICRGPTWNFLGLEGTSLTRGLQEHFVRDTPVVMTRTEDGGLASIISCAPPTAGASSASGSSTARMQALLAIPI